MQIFGETDQIGCGNQPTVGIVWVADEDKPGVAGRGEVADGDDFMSGERGGVGQFAIGRRYDGGTSGA